MKVIIVKKELDIFFFKFKNNLIPTLWGEKIPPKVGFVYDVTFEIENLISINEIENSVIDLFYFNQSYFLIGFLKEIINQDNYIFDFNGTNILISNVVSCNLQIGKNYQLVFLSLTLYDNNY